MQHGHLAARLWGPDWDGREALHSQPPFHSDSLTFLYPSPTFSGARLLRRKVFKKALSNANSQAQVQLPAAHQGAQRQSVAATHTYCSVYLVHADIGSFAWYSACGMCRDTAVMELGSR